MRTAAFAHIPNIYAVARREFVARAFTRTFVVSTLFLALAAGLIGLVPVVIGYFSRDSAQVAVYVGAADLRTDAVATLDALLNSPTSTGSGDAPETDRKAYAVTRSVNLDADREKVLHGGLTALVDVERNSAGDTVFTIYTTEPSSGSGRTAQIIRQAATSIAVSDRLARAGLSGADQASLFAPPAVTIRSPDLTKPASSPEQTAQEIANIAVVFGLEMFLLLAIVLYGTWVAQSVVEEKSSRMMEIILAAASPFEVLTGKVLGVSAAALLQFVAMLAAALVGLLAESQVASAVLGNSVGFALPSGLTASLLVAFTAFFVMGFLLYAVLFAAAGSLVSRQEEVNQIVTPMTLVASVAAMVALYAATGVVDSNASWVVVLSWVPFFSPYMMLSRLQAGTASLLEVGGAGLLLLVAILIAAWVASRIYAAGVLMYGQRFSMRRMLAVVAGR